MNAQRTDDDQWRKGIAESYSIQIDEAQTQEDRDELIRMIRGAVDAGHLYQSQATPLLKRLGVATEETTEDETDRLAWEAALRELGEKKRTVAMEIEDLRTQAKAAKDEYNRLDAEMNRLVFEGSKGFKSRKLF